MKKTSFQDYLWRSFLNSRMGIFVVISGLVSVIAYFISPNTEIQIKYLIFTLFIAFALIYVALKTAYKVYQDLQFSLNSLPFRPKVIHAREPSKYYSNAYAILVTEPTDCLPNDSIVSIYLLIDQFEELIAIGKVINVQDDKKVQVLITYDHALDRHRERIMENEKELLDRIMVKPTIPSFILQGALNFG